MKPISNDLPNMVRAYREENNLTQGQLADRLAPDVNRSNIAHLEQSLRVPKFDVLEKICSHFGIPREFWGFYADKKVIRRVRFELILSELVGSSVTLSNFDSPTHLAAERQINTLFDSNLDRKKTFDLLKTILVYYGVPRMSFEFYDYFLGEDAFMKLDRFQQAIRKYQMKAIRLFSTFREAYTKLNKEGDLKQFFRPLEPLKKIEIDLQYKQRTSWDAIEIIDESKLRYLGYIAAREVRQERNNRQALVDFLIELAAKLKNAESNVDAASVVDHYSEKKKRKMSSLLTKYRSNLKHSLLSPLFPLDPDLIQREADFLSTGIEDSDLNVMEETQSIAVKNLAQYLTADHMDVYVATSMRTESDFVSVNRFVERLFNNELMVPLNLRYFNPTQSWIEDRVAKGLVEALMLKRANYCIYMAQKEDTFGKDSEASVALGQGKTVIVYVPKLSIPKAGIDMEDISKKGRDELINEIKKIGEDDDLDIDKTEDEAAIQSRFLTILLKKMDQKLLAGAAIDHWADFDLYGESERFDNVEQRKIYRKWLDEVIKDGKKIAPPKEILESVHKTFIATAMGFERRAIIFREIHPLALQIILYSGVLNGILVTRSVDSSAKLLNQLIENNLELYIEVDENNYKLIEKSTRSIIRVISRNELLSNSFLTHYSTTNQKY